MQPLKKGAKAFLWICGIMIAGFAVLLLLSKLGAFGEHSPLSALSTPKNMYDPGQFRQDGNFIRYGENSLVGIDVSSHQGEIDWPTVRDAGVEFAILRGAYRGYTDGALSADTCFERNYTEARNAGIQLGVYVFSQAVSIDEVREEAEFVLTLLDGRPLERPIYFDWEIPEGNVRTQDVQPGELTDFAKTFCQTVEAAGYKGGVYFNQLMGYTAFDLGLLQDYDLWLAQYESPPDFFYHFDMWQYTPENRLPGINEDVDMDLIFQK